MVCLSAAGPYSLHPEKLRWSLFPWCPWPCEHFSQRCIPPTKLRWLLNLHSTGNGMLCFFFLQFFRFGGGRSEEGIVVAVCGGGWGWGWKGLCLVFHCHRQTCPQVLEDAMENENYIGQISMAHYLSIMQIFPDSVLGQIFTFDYLEEVDSIIEGTLMM